jgi:hypothetical protein
MIIIIALVGWGHPKHNGFSPKDRKVSCMQYTTLWHASNVKKGRKILVYFLMYFDEMQEKVAETWRIPPEVVEEHKNIANFQVSRHNMWIQAKMDPNKNWLQMRYCVTGKKSNGP